MANFDSNQWYQLYNDGDDSSSLFGSNLYNSSLYGTTFFKKTNLSMSGQLWQIFPVNASTYILRNNDGGPQALLGTTYDNLEDTPGQTRPRMIRDNISDSSVYWSFGAWGDGTFYLWNQANGSDWHLKEKSNTLLALDSNVTSNKGQSFSWKTVSAINNKKYSTGISTATSTADGPSSASATSTSQATSSASSPPSSGHTGLSTGAKAAIGASIGAVALIAIVVGVLFFLRKRKRGGHSSNPYNNVEQHHEMGGAPVKYELYQDERTVKYEMQDTQVQSPPQEPSELPDTAINRPANP